MHGITRSLGRQPQFPVRLRRVGNDPVSRADIAEAALEVRVYARLTRSALLRLLALLAQRLARCAGPR